MAPTIDFRKRTRQTKGYNLRKQTVRPGVLQLRQARQSETESVPKRPAPTERYSVLNDPKFRAPKKAPKQVLSREAITEQNQTSSPFLRLPPELRNNIYKFVGQKVTLGRRARDFSLYGEKELSLLLTCRQFNYEAAGLISDHQTLRLGWGYHRFDLRDLYFSQLGRTKLSIWNVSKLEIHYTFYGIYGFVSSFDPEWHAEHRQPKPELLAMLPNLQHIEAFGIEGKDLPAVGLAWLEDLCCGDQDGIKVVFT